MPTPDKKEWDEGYFVNPSGITLRGFKEDRNPTGKSEYIAAGWAHVDAILESHNHSSIERSFVIHGAPAHGKEFMFTIKAKDASDGRKLKAALVNEFGIDSTGQLNLNVIQKLSKNPRYITLINRPQWLNGRLMAPGLATDDVEFNLERKVAVHFSDKGDEGAGVNALDCFLNAWDHGDAALLLAVFLGAPVVARLWPDERFALFLVGMTGTKKTAAVMLLNSIYGTRYNLESNLVRWGDGATSNATEHLAAMTGPFPFVIDNFKNYTDSDPGRLQRMIHALLEGTEKDRLNKNSELRSAEEYSCLPVVTGENYPGQDAATRARIVSLDWVGPKNIQKLSAAQEHIEDLNAIGKSWCLWLSSEEGGTAMDEIGARFDVVRTQYLTQAKDAVNAGRLATNAAVISLIWDLIGTWPLMADLAEEYSEPLKVAVEDHIFQSQVDVIEDLDSEKFISWLQAELETGRYMFSNPPVPVRYRDHYTESIGIYRLNKDVAPAKGEALILPSVFSSILLPTWQKSVTGVKADKKALLRQLANRGYLSYNEKSQIFTYNRKIEMKDKRVLVFDWVKTTGFDEAATGENVAANRGAEPTATGATGATP
jgi:hypothetical protein